MADEQHGKQGLDPPETPAPEDVSFSHVQPLSPTGAAARDRAEVARRSPRHAFRMISVLSTCAKVYNQLDNVHHDNHRRDIQMAKLFSVIALPILVLIIILAISLSQAVDLYNTALQAKMDIDEVFLIDDLITNLQVERGTTATFLSSALASPEAMTGPQQNTDKALVELREWNGNIFFGARVFTTRSMFHAFLHEHRKATRSRFVKSAESMKFYTDINNALINWVNTLVVLPENTELGPLLVAMGLMLRASDSIGTQRALGAISFLVCGLTPESITWFTQEEGSANTLLELATIYYYESRGARLESFGNSTFSDRIQTQRDQIHSTPYRRECATFDDAVKAANSDRWFAEMTAYMTEIKTIRKTLRRDVIVLLDEMGRDNKKQVVIYIAMIVVITTVCLAFGLGYVIWLRNMTRQMSRQARQTADKLEHFAIEQKRAGAPLYQMLPKSVVNQLKVDKEVKAEFYPKATIAFSDLVGFTAMSARSTALQVVDMLNKLYSLFDASIDRYDVCKVETIGDAYMLVSGVPNPNLGQAAEMAQLALELLCKAAEFSVPHLHSDRIKLRLGIHTGSCMAGVVGKKMPRYCLFGDTVNTASTMESNGEAGKIHISDSTHMELWRTGGFVMADRGTRKMKGLGVMATYWLLDVDKELIRSTAGSRISTSAD